MRGARKADALGFTLIELMIVVAIVGILAVLAIYGVRKYLASAKTAEARNSVGQIAKDAATAFEKESMKSIVIGAGATSAVTRALCAPASLSVPSTITSVQGKKYQSFQTSGSDWRKDEATNKGFACLKFMMSAPQYYMYSYTSDGDVTVPTTGTQFTATANGDLNGDAVTSTFQLFGAVAANQLYISPNMYEVKGEE
jgi:type IV pilus assembly protein PilA